MQTDMEMKTNIPVKKGMKWLWKASRGGVSLTFVWLCKHLIDIATRQADGSITTGLAALAACIPCNCCCSP